MSADRWLAIISIALLLAALATLWRTEEAPAAPPGFRRLRLTITILVAVSVALTVLSAIVEWHGAHR